MSIQLSPKLRRIEEGVIQHWCPACNGRHNFWVNPTKNPTGSSWMWDGNVDRPTFSPSMHIFVKPWTDEETGKTIPGKTICHYFVSEGRISYCSDSSHTLSGQTIDLPDFPADLAVEV